MIESFLFVLNDEGMSWMGGGDHSTNSTTHNHGTSVAGDGQENLSASADWAQMLDAATQRRTEVLMPENLENMWARGRNYRRKQHKKAKAGFQDPSVKNPATDANSEGKSLHSAGSDPLLNVGGTNMSKSSPDPDKEFSSEADHHVDEVKDIKEFISNKYKDPLKGTGSSSLLGSQPHKVGSPRSELQNTEFEKHGEGFRGKNGSDMVTKPKLRCRVCTFE